jgi:hypothetical protein
MNIDLLSWWKKTPLPNHCKYPNDKVKRRKTEIWVPYPEMLSAFCRN